MITKITIPVVAGSDAGNFFCISPKVVKGYGCKKETHEPQVAKPKDLLIDGKWLLVSYEVHTLTKSELHFIIHVQGITTPAHPIYRKL